MSEIDLLPVGLPPEMMQNWGWFLAFGIGLVRAGNRCHYSVSKGHHNLDVVLRMAVADCGRYRGGTDFPGRQVAGLLPAFAGGDSLRSNRRTVCEKTGDQRRGRDPLHGHVLPDVRAVSTGQLAGDPHAGMGLVHAGRNSSPLCWGFSSWRNGPYQASGRSAFSSESIWCFTAGPGSRWRLLLRRL